eukprot:CAMPEP_0172577558 /NCGR_PEP_ID=MMETSP1067-20121228/138295_1 /TAXON_ID=265564 ORGANISM="Thalassiosira punctigera, Strain Tpunct2005C2" /NCGR_SAMPLE_ID=MMETSP1067 /ASSEMBLY_ACC=CAM_ASM_000444 /LENGTH=242 /DNA_ID=CAMNT_0013370249 /DNA_START=25 /DNA_END=753 /DNA_ORIENTATION=-
MKSQRINARSTKREAVSSCSRPAESRVVPFPGLPGSASPRRAHSPTTKSSHKRGRETVHVIPFSSSITMPRSAPISLPETHIQRTPSELQLAVDTVFAEYKDVVMYSRLMTGMHNQIQRRCMMASGTREEKGGSAAVDVHPLSRKSMLGIVRTYQANDQELEQQQHASYQDQQAPEERDDRSDEGDVGWDMSYSPIDEEAEHWSIVSSGPPSRQTSKDSLSTLLHDLESDDQEDDCLFSMEL